MSLKEEDPGRKVVCNSTALALASRSSFVSLLYQNSH